MAVDPRRVKELFVAALDLPTGPARRAFLDGACGGEADLRQRLDVLLQAHEDPASVLDRPLAEVVRAEPGTTPADSGGAPPTAAEAGSLPGAAGLLLAGRYQLLEVIG